ncbi:MAG: dephospho-CoA kinase [Chlamydiales bacterium]|nr:dephospho-CoA kinase [Chlamydiales bacterium]
MLTLNKVAVTGGLASGKSSVCQILKACGAYVISADKVVHELLTPNSVVGQRVIDLLGSEILNDHKIDRDKIAKKVFSSPELLDSLEKILHPAVLNEIQRAYQKTREDQKHSLFVAEIPLLYESESHEFFDVVIAVVSDETLCQKRYADATKRTSKEYYLRMKRQLEPHVKAAKADYVITNNGTYEDLKHQVQQLYQTHLLRN